MNFSEKRNDDMEAIILAGGFGTRLRRVVSDVPKPMALVNEKPFLQYILDYLKKQGVCRVVLAVGYMHEKIKNFFGDQYAGMELIYSIEKAPLFTGGAIKQALMQCKNDEVFVINGDTFFDVDLTAMQHFHERNGSDLTLAIRYMTNFERYGTLERKQDRIVAFHEKKKTKAGYINGGVYFMKKNLLDTILEEKFSFEKDFMEKQTKQIQILGFESDGYFIDIGVPEDYAKAQEDFVDYRWE